MELDSRSSTVTECKAIDGSGLVGSFYDNYEHRVLRQYAQISLETSTHAYKQAKCSLIRGDSNESQNLLQTIGMHDQLRLSLWLGLTRAAGIAAVINCDDPIDSYTRILYYSWNKHEEHCSQENLRLNQIVGNNPNATHLITGIRFGIDVIAIMQLPSDHVTATRIDDLLERIRATLSSDADIVSTFTAEENRLMESISKLRGRSNTASLTGLLNLSNLLSRIIDIKKNARFCHPMAYFLRPLYPIDHSSDIYHTLPATLHGQVEEFVLRKFFNHQSNSHLSSTVCLRSLY